MDGDRLLSPEEGGWSEVAAPSPIPFAANYAEPQALDLAGIGGVKQAFVAATHRALAAGFDLIEIHAAHAISSTSSSRPSPISAQTSTAAASKTASASSSKPSTPSAPHGPPAFPSLSASPAIDWVEGGWDLDQSVALAKVLKQHGVDLVDCSSGGIASNARITTGPGYQVPFAERIRAEAQVPTGAVGMITGPAQADQIIRAGQADLVLLAREFLRDPYWPLTPPKSCKPTSPGPPSTSAPHTAPHPTQANHSLIRATARLHHHRPRNTKKQAKNPCQAANRSSP